MRNVHRPPAPDSSWTRAVAWLGGVWAFSSRRRTARLLSGFARTEHQSQLELRQAAAGCGDERRRSLYLRHALDEARHALAFAERAAEISGKDDGAETAHTMARSEDLFETLGEIRFLAFVHRGERRGRTEFEVYAKLLERRGKPDLAGLFRELASDERGHEAYSEKLLAAICDEREQRRALAWARRREAWLGFRRQGKRLGGLVYAVAMFIAYVLLAPYALLWRYVRKEHRGFSGEA